MKRIAFLLVALMPLLVAAQEEGQRKASQLDVQLGIGISAIGLNGNLQQYMQANHPASDYKNTDNVGLEITLADSWRVHNMHIGINASLEVSSSASRANQYTDVTNSLGYLSLGYEFNLGKNFMLEPEAGIGVADATTYLATKRSGSDQLFRYTTSHLAVPLTLRMWWGTDEGRIGLYLRYSFYPTQIGTTRLLGLQTDVSGLSLKPGALSAGMQFRF